MSAIDDGVIQAMRDLPGYVAASDAVEEMHAELTRLREQCEAKDAEIERLSKLHARQWCESCGAVSISGQCDCTRGGRQELRNPIDYADAMQKEAREQFERAEAAESDIASLRAKLERAKEVAKEAIDEYEDNSHYKSEYLQEKHGDVAEIARLRAILSELSADAPAQQTQISDEAVEDNYSGA